MRNTISYSSEVLLVEGGTELKGSVRVSGSKNAALPIMFASMLTEETCRIRNVPDLLDVRNTCTLLKMLGVEIKREGESVALDGKGVRRWETPKEIVRRMRASILSMGPLLARFRRARVALPGGCSIGPRPIDQHLKFFSSAGASVLVKEGYVSLEIKKKKPVEFSFDIVTVTGTENALLYLSGVEGRSVLKNIALEPEVMDLVSVLTQMGARINVEGRTAVIEGRGELGGFEHRIIPDRIEAGTFMVAGAITGGEIVLEDVELSHMGAVVEKLEEAGISVEALKPSRVRVRRKGELKPLELKTSEYPGFPTDMQAQFMAMLDRKS
ncbi:MAG TPA: UDP-N-acetylglucosamine 1-carboxyvinyltransferase, partial [Aquificaceae bacterium]|nr:UDP-N-acetylglucosamine 1-carboxyvinyltransferase [Aquificaceae bacterium]